MIVLLEEQLKKRFCKDTNIAIKIYKEPYFHERLDLYEDMFGARTKYERFMTEVKKFKTPQDYFQYYIEVKEAAMNFIKSTEKYQEFISCDMNKYEVKTSIPARCIYREELVGKRLLSIDLSKGCFTALKWFDRSIVDYCDSYEEFIGRFCGDMENIKNSKYIRQVILGNCNPRRQVAIEKFLMNKVFMEIVPNFVSESNIISFTDDEIVLDATNFDDVEINYIREAVKRIENVEDIHFHFDVFTLKKVSGLDVYLRYFTTGEVDIKCANHLTMPLILRHLKGEDIQPMDILFEHEGMIAKFIEVPEIQF